MPRFLSLARKPGSKPTTRACRLNKGEAHSKVIYAQKVAWRALDYNTGRGVFYVIRAEML
jgi:hypothetical protein